MLIGKSEDTDDSMGEDVQRAMEKWHFHAERFRRDFDVERPDVFIHEPEPLPTKSKKWGTVCKLFRQHLEQLNQKLPGRREYHVFLNGPSALAVELGAACGTKFEMVVHQWDPGLRKVPYFPVGDLSKLNLEDKHGLHSLVDPVTDEFQYITKPEAIDSNEQIAVSLYIAKEDPHPEVRRYMAKMSQNQGMAINILEINQKQKRRFDSKDDWIRCAKEILTVINGLFSDVQRERVHIFLSAPVALAFMIGLGLEHFRPITIYNWWPEERNYHPVIFLENLARTVIKT